MMGWVAIQQLHNCLLFFVFAFVVIVLLQNVHLFLSVAKLPSVICVYLLFFCGGREGVSVNRFLFFVLTL